MDFRFISGLPRTGSTVLSAILNQNPRLHAEGTSNLYELMNKTDETFNTERKLLKATNRDKLKTHFLSEVPRQYYKDINKEIIVDKSRYWTLRPDLITEYLSSNPKVVVLVRPIEEIVKSFLNIQKLNGWESDAFDLVTFNMPILDSFTGVEKALDENRGQYLFVTYNNLMNDTSTTIKKIYEFFELEPYNHDFNNIKTEFEEDDTIYGSPSRPLLGLHELRPSLSTRTIDIELPANVIKKCEEMNYKIASALNSRVLRIIK